MKSYTGVGSRSCPKDIQRRFTKLASFLEEKNYILRSGGADGADFAFERGVKKEENKEIYLPWRGFNNSKSKYYNIPKEAFIIASQIHPAWDKCSDAVKKLHARNVMQVKGESLDDPSSFLVCWTENGEDKGGTRTAIVLARDCGVPVFNFEIDGDDLKLWEFIKNEL